VPESFKVLVKELQSLGLAVQVENESGGVTLMEDIGSELPELDLNLSGFEREDVFHARG
jgi:DNA-directed RNA polymerase subunit beta